MIEASDQVLAPLDPEMASLVAREIRANGVELYLGASAVKIDESTVEISSGEIVAADLVIMAIGVRPDIHLAQDAGLEIGPRKGIKVDEFNLTSDKSIYAIGDVAEKTDSLDGSSTLVPLANIANRHGRIVADHIAGRKIRPVKTIGTAIVKVFDLMIATTGWNEKKLKATSRAYRVIHAHPNSHAGYYPDAKQMTLKLIFDPLNGEILGAQGVGVDGVDKRLDVISTAIRGGIKAQELADLELAYAPPFGSAKDPVNMLGYIAENVISGLVETAQWDQIEDYRAKGYELVDVRTQGEFDRGTIPGAINVPVDEIRERAQEFQGKNLLVTCQVGQRGHTASLLLKSLGFNPVNLDGGYLLWSNSPAAKELVQKK
jgi:rhodanese-related sulfurtransferase